MGDYDKADYKFEVIKHNGMVRDFISIILCELLDRASKHDTSKLVDPELSLFSKNYHNLKSYEYASKEYFDCLVKLKPAIETHHGANRHHPEHFKDGISGMNLIDLIEMVCDWKAATLITKNGDIFSSLDKNRERFNFGTELYSILKNTVDFIENYSNKN